MKHLLPLLSLPLLSLVTMAVGSCGSQPLAEVGDGGTCTYQGETHDGGTPFPAGDGCNTCTCSAGGVTCSTVGCSDAGASDASDVADLPSTCFDVTGRDVPCYCAYNGRFYDLWATFAASDGCSACTCETTGVTCIDMACRDAGPGDAGGASVPCSYGGTVYMSGSSFPATDGCNKCTCSDGVVGCTTIACVSDAGVSDGGQKGVCTPGADQTCNDDPTISSLLGKCQPDGSCVCSTLLTSSSGRCINGCEISFGKVVPVGATFTCADGCNSCRCAGYNHADMTVIGCAPGDANTCHLDSVYDYGFIGGLVAYSDRARLMPDGIGGVYGLVRTFSNASNAPATVAATCVPPLPGCGNPMAIDIGDIIADLGDPTVQKLLASTDASPFLVGLDTRPVDGPIFSIQRAGARQLLVGAPCNDAVGCTDIPAPIAKLVKDLTALDQQQLANPRCAAITTGAFACGSTKCRTGLEYCARATVGGAEKVAVCRPYLPSCTSCGCAAQDAASVLGPASPSTCSNAANFGCFDDLGYQLLGSLTSAALSVLCAAP